MASEEPDAIERVIDEALAGYANVEPLVGLEARVLQRVHAEGARRFGFWGWAMATGIAATAGAVLFAVPWVRSTPASLRLRVVAPQAPQIAEVTYVPPVSRRIAPRPAPATRPQFPTPAPLTSEERALLALATHAPEEARDLHRRLDEPIQIEEIKIAPLQIADLR